MALRAEPIVARSPGVSYQELLDTDTRPVPDVLRLTSTRIVPDEDVAISHYISRAWHELEVERLWKRVWQFACREDDIQNPGDHHVYDIAGLSFLIVRTETGAIKAFPNACLHRGRRLKDHDGYCSEIRCPFHGFAWHLDGSLQDIPAQWDFPHVDPDEFQLPEIRVGTWAGFVFINPDAGAEPLESFLGELVEQFAGWDLARFYTEAHVARILPANWKIAQEAFCEALHVNATHPQILPYLGDTNSQVDVWENFARVITPGGTPSPLLDWRPSEDEMLRSMLDVRVDENLPVVVGPGRTMRETAADLTRDRWRAVLGTAVDTISDAELMDSIDYTVFPNFHPWGALNRIVYRFRPNGNDHRSCIMEVLFLSPFQGDRPEPARVHWLAPDEPWSEATELGLLGKVFDQDTFNIGKVQLGLETTTKPGVTLAGYQESKIRWLHDKLAEWVGEAG